uniref:Transmembrane and immunoglobulin domain containing 1 n=1 Tax=Sphaeramia orbicularis TaxID=375764 RepID=A0A673A8K3_9TELE
AENGFIHSLFDVIPTGILETKLDETVSLVCKYEDEPDEELVWKRNDALVSLKDENKKGLSRVCITPIDYEDNEVTFTCQLGKNSTVRAFVTLNVTYPPSLSGSEDVSVEEESVFALQCDIGANPPVTSVTWEMNGTAVDVLAGGFTISTGAFTSRLTADSTEKNLHENTYQCSAVSPMYGTHSKVFHVTVTAKTMKFPLMPMIAGLVVVCLTTLLAIVSRWKKITKVQWHALVKMFLSSSHICTEL